MELCRRTYFKENYGDTNQRFYGRGILSGRQYTWMPGASEEDGRLKELVTGGVNTVFSGIMIMESPNHGIVSRNDCTFENVKMLGCMPITTDSDLEITQR